MLHSWHLYVRQWNILVIFLYHCNIIAHNFWCKEDTGIWSAVCKNLWGQWRKCMYDVPSWMCCMPCFIYLCHVSYIYAMFCIFMPWYIYLCHDLYIFMPCSIYFCHVLYIYAMIYIFMPCFIYLCHVLYIYVNFNTCRITIHLCCTKISIFVVLSLSFLLYQLKFMLYQLKFMLYQLKFMLH